MGTSGEKRNDLMNKGGEEDEGEEPPPPGAFKLSVEGVWRMADGTYMSLADDDALRVLGCWFM